VVWVERAYDDYGRTRVPIRALDSGINRGGFGANNVLYSKQIGRCVVAWHQFVRFVFRCGVYGC